MRPAAILFVVALLAGAGPSDAQTTGSPKSGAIKPEDLANEWFIRLNELDDWYISYDGKEENQKVVDPFLELYADDAFHQVGPSATQIGPVIFHGKDAIARGRRLDRQHEVSIDVIAGRTQRVERRLDHKGLACRAASGRSMSEVEGAAPDWMPRDTINTNQARPMAAILALGKALGASVPSQA